MQGMIKRDHSDLIRRRLKAYPVCALVGPRQAGKTTLARSLGGRYFDLEQEGDRLQLDLQWESLLAGHDLVILDEAQEWPEIFKRLRGAVDQARARNGRFLLLGSVSLGLMRQVSETLAGRMALVELTPLLWGELSPRRRRNLWLVGGYPDGGILRPDRFPIWQQNYLETLAARDLPNWGLPARPQTTLRLIRMLAAVHGQTLNASQLGRSLDLSYKTIQTYLDYLEGAFLVRQLPPYYANLKKRLVKSPKVYWRDTGLLHAILNVTTMDQLLSQPWVGADWEGFVIEQIISALRVAEVAVSPHFLRTSDQHEIDLVLDFGPEKWAVEIKLTASPGPADLQRLSGVADLIGARRRILISRTTRIVESERTVSGNLDWLLQEIHGRPGRSSSSS
jgi:uncharacterized protein